MFRTVTLALVFAISGMAQNGASGRPRSRFLGSRRNLALMGAAVAGAGAALLATAGRTRQVPASNCSFYPGGLLPCIPAHSESTRSGAQSGAGGGLLVGGFVMVYASMR